MVAGGGAGGGGELEPNKITTKHHGLLQISSVFGTSFSLKQRFSLLFTHLAKVHIFSVTRSACNNFSNNFLYFTRNGLRPCRDPATVKISSLCSTSVASRVCVYSLFKLRNMYVRNENLSKSQTFHKIRGWPHQLTSHRSTWL
jgi:hypothetical protein